MLNNPFKKRLLRKLILESWQIAQKCRSQNMCRKRYSNKKDPILSLVNAKYGCIIEAAKRGNCSAVLYYLETDGDPNRVRTIKNPFIIRF